MSREIYNIGIYSSNVTQATYIEPLLESQPRRLEEASCNIHGFALIRFCSFLVLILVCGFQTRDNCVSVYWPILVPYPLFWI